jgi:Mn2+/Fe2+ NRAMP family transporter
LSLATVLQQSYVVDKRITPRFVRYTCADLWIGIVLVIIGAVTRMAFTGVTFADRPEFGNFQDAGRRLNTSSAG